MAVLKKSATSAWAFGNRLKRKLKILRQSKRIRRKILGRLIRHGFTPSQARAYVRAKLKKGETLDSILGFATKFIEQDSTRTLDHYLFHPDMIQGRPVPSQIIENLEGFHGESRDNYGVKIHGKWYYYDRFFSTMPHFVLYDKRGKPIYSIAFDLHLEPKTIRISSVHCEGVLHANTRRELAKHLPELGLGTKDAVHPQEFICDLFIKQAKPLIEKGYKLKLDADNLINFNQIYRPLIDRFFKKTPEGEYVLDLDKKRVKQILGLGKYKR